MNEKKVLSDTNNFHYFEKGKYIKSYKNSNDI